MSRPIGSPPIVDLPQSAKPVDVAVAPHNKTIFVANGHGNSVAFIDAAANEPSGDVTVIDVASRKPIGTVKTGEGAWGVVIGR